MNRFVCAIESIDYLNHDTRRVILSLPDGSARLTFKAGQYLNVVLAEKLCPFSIASPPELKGKVEVEIEANEASLKKQTENRARYIEEKQKAEEEERIKEENRRIKEWEEKFDKKQKEKEKRRVYMGVG